MVIQASYHMNGLADTLNTNTYVLDKHRCSLIEQSLVLFVTAILESIIYPGQSELDSATRMTQKKARICGLT